MSNLVLGADIQVGADELTRLIKDLPNMSQDAAKELNRILGGDIEKRIELQVETKGANKDLKAVEREYLSVVDKIRTEQKKLAKTEVGSTTSLRQAVNEAKKARDGIVKYIQTAGGLTQVNAEWAKQNQRVQRLGSELRKVDGSGFWDRIKADLGVGQILSFANGLSQIVQGFQAVSIVVGQAIGSINSLTDSLAKLQSFSLSFQAIGAGASGAQEALAESSRIALGLGVAINTTREGFQQLSPVILNSGGTLGDVSAIMESLSSRFAAFGLNGDKARRVTVGIIQAFGKGKLQAEELTQQIAEADPAFGTDLARALGVSTAEMLKMVKAGEINVDVLLRTLPLLSKSSLLYGRLGSTASDAVSALATSGGEVNVTFEQVRNKIATLNQLSLEQLSKSVEPFLVALLSMQAGVTDFFASLARSSAVKALGSALGGLAGAFNTALQAVLTAATGFLTVIEPIARIIDFLLKIPAVAQIAGAAILLNLVAPLKALQISAASAAASGQAIAGGLFSKIAAASGQAGAGVTSLGSATKASTTASVAAADGYVKQARSLGVLATAQRSAAQAAAREQSRLDGLRKQRSSLLANTKGGASVVTTGLDKSISQSEQRLKGFTAAQERAKAKFGELNQAVAKNGQALAANTALTRAGGAEYSKLTKQLGSLQAVNRLATTGLATTKTSLTSVNQAFQGGDISAKQYSERVALIGKEAARLGFVQSQTASRIEGLNGRLAGLSTIASGSVGAMTKLGRGVQAFGGLAKTAFSGAAAGAGAIASALGPVGIALIAVGVLQGAYTSAMQKSTEATEKAKLSAETFKDILKDLANVEIETPDPEGYSLLWKTFAATAATEFNATAEGGEALVAALQGDFGKLQQINPFGFFQRQLEALKSANNLKGFLAIKQFALDVEGQLEATAKRVEDLRNALAKLREQQAAPPREGETPELKEARVLKGFNSTQELSSEAAQELSELEKQYDNLNKKYIESGRSNEDLRKKMEELNTKIKDQRADLTLTQTALVNFGAEIGALSDKQISGAVSTFEALGETAKDLKGSLEIAVPDSREFGKFAADLAATEAAIERLKRKAEDPIVLKAGISTALIENSTKIAAAQARLTEAQSKGDVLAIARVRTELAKLDRDRKNLQALKIELDASSLENASKAIKDLEEKIVKVGVSAPELPSLIGQLESAKQVLNSREFSKTEIELNIKAQGLQDGSIVASANELKEVTSLLDNQIARLSIEAPGLPVLIEELEGARQQIDDLDGKKATLTVEVIEKGLAAGDLSRTGALLDRRVSAQQAVVSTTPTGAVNYDQEVQKLKQFEAEKKASLLTTDELQEKLATNELERQQAVSDASLAQAKIVSENFTADIDRRKQAVSDLANNEIAAIQRVATADAEASERRKAAIQSRAAATAKRFDDEIARLNQLTASEQKLEDKRLEALRKTARQPGEEGLQAKAELERLERTKQIAAIEQKKQQAAEAAAKELAQEERKQQEAAKAAAEKIAEVEKKEKEELRKLDEEARKKKEELMKLELENEKKKEALLNKQLQEEEKGRTQEDEAIKKELKARGEGLEIAKEVTGEVVDSGNIINDSWLPAMIKGREEMERGAKAILDLDGKVITVFIREVTVAARAAGGPVFAGQSYKVNELGREGFVDTSGRVSEISKSANSQWRAPSSGYVIPAHIWAGLEVPKAGVKVGRPPAGVSARGSDSRLINALRAVASSRGDSGVKESIDKLSEIQARQAMKIGRLGSAISELAEKDWSVSVHVPPSNSPRNTNMTSRGLA